MWSTISWKRSWKDYVALKQWQMRVYGEGDTMNEAQRSHDDRLRHLLTRCRERNIMLNKKLQLSKTEMPYIGHLLTRKGVKADPEKLEQ